MPRSCDRAAFGSLHPRLAASLAIIPLSLGLAACAISAISAGERMSVIGGTFALHSMPPMALALLWRRTIFRGPSAPLRFMLLAALSGAPVVGCLIVLAGVWWMLPLVVFYAYFIVNAVVMIFLTVVCWRPRSPADLVCPACRYDMRGQRSCRCPECGAEFTVGELIRGRQRPLPLGCVRI